MTPIELTEHGPAVIVALDGSTARALEQSKFVRVTPVARRPGHWHLKPGRKVGTATITASGSQPVTVNVTPKLPIRRLLFLLGYARYATQWPDEDVVVSPADDLVPVTARLYVRQLEKALRQGLLHGYRPVEESSLLVRGRIRENDQLRAHYGLPLPVEITHDEFTVDIAENRILRTACEHLGQLPDRVPDDVRRRLLQLRRRFADITPLSSKEALPSWRPSRLNTRFQPVLRLAELVLVGRSVEHQPGDVSVTGFFFDMYQIFEDFVTVALREAFPQDGRTDLQKELYLDDGRAIRMKPDLVFRSDDGVPVAVADAKYKVEKSGGYPDADLYQMLAYCTALDLSEGHLLYAKGFAPHRAHWLRQAGITLHQHALDLDQAPAALLTQIRGLAVAMTPAAPPN